MKKIIKEKTGVSLVGLIILIAIIATFVIIIRWAVGLSNIVNERTKQNRSVDVVQLT